MADTYKVIQADRIAAWKLAPECYAAEDKDGWMRGTYDFIPTIQTFAKHREDTEALIVGWLRAEAGKSGVARDWAKVFADAIARGDHHTNNTPGD